MSNEVSQEGFSARTLVFSILLAIIGTVIVLTWQGKIKHNEAKDQYALSEYKVVAIPNGEDQKYRLSPKDSHQSAFCEQGYLFIGNDTDKTMQGLLVDYKNRGIKCDEFTSSTAIEHGETSNEQD
jgi:hypothetical protein